MIFKIPSNPPHCMILCCYVSSIGISFYHVSLKKHELFTQPTVLFLVTDGSPSRHSQENLCTFIAAEQFLQSVAIYSPNNVEWMTSLPFTSLICSVEILYFSSLQLYQDEFCMSGEEQMLSAWICLALSAQGQAVHCWSLGIFIFIYEQCNKAINTTDLCGE